MSTAAADVTFTLKDGDKLTVEANGWSQEKPAMVSYRTSSGTLGAGARLLTSRCDVALQALVAAKPSAKVIASPRWAPPSWHSQALSIPDVGTTTFGLCRPYKSNSLFVMVTFRTEQLADATLQDKARVLLAQIDAAASSAGLPTPPTAKPASVDTISEASEEVEEEGVPLTLKGPNGPSLTIHVPTGYRMAGDWISKSGDVDRDGIRIGLYPTDIDCKTGMVARKDETLESPPAGTPKTFHDLVAVRNGDKGFTYTMCSDIVGGVMIAEVDTDHRRGELAMEHAKILASVSTAAHASDRTAPPQPKFVFSDLGGRTFEIPAKAGGWRAVVFLGFAIKLEWPRSSNASVLMLATDACTYSGSHSLIPSPWKADAVAQGVRGCIDANGTKFQLGIMVDTASLSPADQERIKETATALATAVYPGTSPYVAPSPAVAAVDSTSSTTSSEPSTPYVPSYSSDGSYHRPLRTYLYGASVAGHMFAVDGRDDSYGFSIGYGRSLAPRLRMQLEGGYNNASGLLFDGRIELGSYFGEPEIGIGVWGMLGVDGLGLGRDDAMADPATVAPRIAADLYYGARVELVLSSISGSIGYVGRNADIVDHAWRFDLGYRLERGHNLGFRYTGYGDAGHFLALYYRY